MSETSDGRSRFIDLGDARVDVRRADRTSIPEVVFAESKTIAQIVAIMRELYTRDGFALATRIPEGFASLLLAELPTAVFDERARALRLGRLATTPGTVGILCAGTSDLPVADEAAFTLEAFGHRVVRRTDVGVAGLHRLLADFEELQTCDALIVVAGMEGALPSVVAGLARPPVIAVPTSIGYGVSAGGFTALHAMLASCSPGIAVVNIDNGFGAAAFAHKLIAARFQRVAD